MERILEELAERRLNSEVGLSNQRPRATEAKDKRVACQQSNQQEEVNPQHSYGKENQTSESVREHVMKHLRKGSFHCQVCNEGFSCPPWLKDQMTQPSSTHSGREEHVMEKGLHDSRILTSAGSNLNRKTHVRDSSCIPRERRTVTNKRKRATPFDDGTPDRGSILKGDCSVKVGNTEQSVRMNKVEFNHHYHERGEALNNENKDPQGNHTADVEAKKQSDLTCDVCDNSSKRKKRSKHCTCQKTKKSYECSVCGRSFRFLNMHKKHMASHSNERPFLCPVCGKGYKYPSTLKEHVMFKHEGPRPRPHLCDMCGSAFAKPSQLQFHLTVHTGERSFQCELCPKSFRIKSTLRVHMAWHKGDRPHECETCGKRYLNSAALTEHRRVHSREKPYNCKICSRAFAHLRTLRNHERIHSGDKPYECDICHKRFIQLNGFNYHKKLHEKKETK